MATKREALAKLRKSRNDERQPIETPAEEVSIAAENFVKEKAAEVVEEVKEEPVVEIPVVEEKKPEKKPAKKKAKTVKEEIPKQEDEQISLKSATISVSIPREMNKFLSFISARSEMTIIEYVINMINEMEEEIKTIDPFSIEIDPITNTMPKTIVVGKTSQEKFTKQAAMLGLKKTVYFNWLLQKKYREYRNM